MVNPLSWLILMALPDNSVLNSLIFCLAVLSSLLADYLRDCVVRPIIIITLIVNCRRVIRGRSFKRILLWGYRFKHCNINNWVDCLFSGYIKLVGTAAYPLNYLKWPYTLLTKLLIAHFCNPIAVIKVNKSLVTWL